MALDGIFLSLVKSEIEEAVVGSRVEKVHQPSKEELVLHLRSRTGAYRLLLSARANSPRLNLTKYSPENPAKPPMLCMLMRKYLTSAMITGIRQVGLDRIIFIDFDATNEIGDKIKLSLCIEIMSKYSNIILIDGEGKVIDALKRVDESKSSVRQILPSLEYKLPPAQNKLNILENTAEEVTKTIATMPEKRLSSAMLSTLEGVSPIVCRELAYKASYNDETVKNLNATTDILPQVEFLKNTLENKKIIPTVVKDVSGKPIDFTFINVCQYGDLATVEKYDSFNELLDDYYYERDRLERTHQKAQDLVQKVNTLIQRTAKKLNIQRIELSECDNKEQHKINAELISANVYNLQKGVSSYELFNYYTNENITVKANPALTPMENSQRYYKEYKKAKTAEEMLKKLIENGEAELKYLETVSDALDRSNTAAEIDEIRDELYQGGYIKNKGKAKKIKALPPIEYETSDGFRVLVGRNNIQNDKLSLKTANKNDMWLHSQSFPGSHVIIVSDNREISDLAIEEAASVAAYHSKARGSKIVTVDYTYVKNLKKPAGAKFGKVIYHVYYSINVSSELILKEKTGGNR